MVTQEEIIKWDREDRYNRIFGHDGHMDTAQIEHDLALKAARECHLTGTDGVIEYHKHTGIQMNAAGHLLVDAFNTGLFTDKEMVEYSTRISAVRLRFQEELEEAIAKGCPCAK